MANREVIFHKKLQRRGLTAKKRQASFIAEYVFVKYFDIYKEAANLFNQLNAIHPRRPDLRKSIEFKNWQRQIKGLPEIREYKNRAMTKGIFYQDIPLNTNDHQESEEFQQVNDDVLKDSDIIQRCPQKVMQLNIPLLSIPQDKRQERGETTNHQESEEFQQVNEEVIDEGDTNQDDLAEVQPSIFDDLSQETLDDMISQLQNDPNLAAIMRDFDTDVCMNVQIDNSAEKGHDDENELDIDLDIDDLLEKELNDIIW